MSTDSSRCRIPAVDHATAASATKTRPRLCCAPRGRDADADTTGVTLLQPRKNVPVVVKMLKRGEPPWHWVLLFNVNEPDANGCPFTPVICPNADAFVELMQFFSKCSQPFWAAATGHPVLSGS